VDLGCGFDKVLEVSASEEVPQVNEFTMRLVLDVDDTPAVLAATDSLAVDEDIPLRANNSEGNDVPDGLV